MVRTTIRTPMPAKMRVKQFAMFDAMKGLKEAIAVKERQICPKWELTEEQIEEIDRKLLRLRVGDCVAVYYYCNYGKVHTQITGRVTRIDIYWKNLQINNKTIEFKEISNVITDDMVFS